MSKKKTEPAAEQAGADTEKKTEPAAEQAKVSKSGGRVFLRCKRRGAVGLPRLGVDGPSEVPGGGRVEVSDKYASALSDHQLGQALLRDGDVLAIERE